MGTDSNLPGKLEKCPIPTLHAVSALGTKLCFYQVDTTTDEPEILPRAITRRPTVVNDTAPQKRWDCDILEPRGEAKFRQVVDEIKAECAKLN
jgi:hypothetical protein